MKNIIKNIFIAILLIVIVVGFIILDFQKKDLKSTIDIQENEIIQLKATATANPDTNDDSDDSSKEAETKKEETESSKAENDISLTSTSGSSPTYLELLFWRDGKFYKLNTGDTPLYKNVYLSKKYKGEGIIISPQIDHINLENGQEIYALMSGDGLVYTGYEPELEEIDDPKISISPDIYNQDASKKYIKYKFWKAKKRTLVEDSTQKWYSAYCLSTDSIIDNSNSVEIESRYIYKMTLESQVDVWHGVSSDGMVWMHQQPEIEAYEE